MKNLRLISKIGYEKQVDFLDIEIRYYSIASYWKYSQQK